MMNRLVLWISVVLAAGTAAAASEPVAFDLPGFPSGQMDAAGRVVEDWGTVAVRLSGPGVVDGPVALEAARLDGRIPAARAAANRGAVRLAWIVYRAPAFPSGVDVLSVRVEEAKGQPAKVNVALDVPERVSVGMSTVHDKDRIVLSVPRETVETQEVRPWGYSTASQALRGWAKPEGKCDPAFANIRVGMGGVPIVYRFQVTPGSRPNVVLGLCESHWNKPRRRPLVCRVEGAAAQEVDPVSAWGQHKPGALLFRARDVDRDGKLEIVIRPAPGAADRNTILNAIWIFAPGQPPDLKRVIAGECSRSATYYIDVGGDKDQSLYPSGKLEYPLVLAPGESKELCFLLACPGSSSPPPDTTAWTAAALRRAAVTFWREQPTKH